MRNPLQYAATVGGAFVSTAIGMAGRIGDGLESLLGYVPYIGDNSIFQGGAELLTGLALQEAVFRADDNAKKKQKAIDDARAAAQPEETVPDAEGEDLEAKTKIQWSKIARRWGWRAAKFAASVVSADLILNSFDAIKNIYYGIGSYAVNAADKIPVLQDVARHMSEFNDDYGGLPVRIAGALAGGAIIWAAYKFRHRLVTDDPDVVSRFRVHYRWFPRLHKDWLLSILPISSDYAILKRKRYCFVADCFKEEGKKQYVATITIPPPKLHQLQDVYYRALEMFDADGNLDITNEGSTDPPAEIILAGKAKVAKQICLAYDLDSLAGEKTDSKHTVQEREKGTLEKWYAVPLNAFRNFGRLFSREGMVKLMEMGELYDIAGNFIPSEATESDGKTGKMRLTLNENFVYRAATFGARWYDIEDTDGKKIATIARDAVKRAISLGIWRDYDIVIRDKRYDTDHFRAFCMLLTDAIHNVRTLRKNLGWDSELQNTQVSEIQRYST